MEMEVNVVTSGKLHLHQLAVCHIRSFPLSLTSQLGHRYCMKMLEWYLVRPNRFIIHLEKDGKVIGYCGGFIRSGEAFGSSTGMTQYSFKAALNALIRRPWLLLHRNFLPNYQFLWRNVLVKLKGRGKRRMETDPGPSAAERSDAGLVVIGVEPNHRNKGYGLLLLREFEKKARSLGGSQFVLTVDSTNKPAIASYLKSGWIIVNNTDKKITMQKIVTE